ncbi:MAG: hypothetical protein IKL77_06265 [Clostridia bacterium]|nr:hypothetical protein [Clostridia bacterium]
MKWKHRIKYWLIAFALTIVAAIMMYVGFALYYDTIYFDTVNSVLGFGIGLVSLLISVVALIFSVITYVSIDAVNALSSMEGNVLCNENYNAEYMQLVEQYDDCTTQLDLQKKLFLDLDEYFKKHGKTCMAFTDFLQYFLDRLLWLAYLDTKREDYQIAVRQIIEKIEKKYNEFNAISNGNQYVLREHIKLIKNTLNYQSVSHDGKELDANGKMLNIRGRMLINGVSKTIYYDYLGLEYHKKTLKKIRELTGYSDEEFLSHNMDLISKFSYGEEDKKEIDLYLNQAKLAFEQATLSSEADVLWKGYISFNMARIDLLSYLVNNSFPKNWHNSLEEAIEARYFVRKIFVANNEVDSFLELEFAKEHIYAQALLLSMQHYLSKDKAERVKLCRAAEKLGDEISQINTHNENIFTRSLKYICDITKA